VQVAEQKPFLLNAGELLLLPYGTAHKTMSDPDMGCEHVDDGAVFDIICGYLDFAPLQYFGQNAVFTGLPKLLDTVQSPRLETLFLLELFRSLDHVELELGCWKCLKPFLLLLSLS